MDGVSPEQLRDIVAPGFSLLRAGGLESETVPGPGHLSHPHLKPQSVLADALSETHLTRLRKHNQLDALRSNDYTILTYYSCCVFSKYVCVCVYLNAVFEAVHTASRVRCFVFGEDEIVLIEEDVSDSRFLPSASTANTQLTLTHQLSTLRHRDLTHTHTHTETEQTIMSTSPLCVI